MRIFTLLAIGAATVATGCASVKQPEKETPSLHIEYAKNNWRICSDENCKKPTPKTVEIYSSAPVMANVLPAPAPVAIEQPATTMTVHFILDKAIPTSQGLKELNAVLKRALSSTKDSIEVTGFTDSTGGKSLNDRLAKNRASFVARWLKNHGVKNRITVESKGRCCYIAQNKTEAEMALNRRAELDFKPVKVDVRN